jgi:GT2 family glycosyltransferase
MNLELSVIIVNYNGLKYLKECLESFYKNLEEITFEIIIIDNNSIDASCDYLKTNFPEVKLIESKITYGFGKGNNEAVKTAKGNYLLLINNDTIVLDKIKPVLNFIKNNNKVGVVGINMLNKNKEYLPAAGVFPNFRNMFQFKKLLNLGTEFKNGKFTKENYDVDWLSGSFLLLSKETYDNINGFDEDYFMYVEDVDFCKKIADIGLKRVFIPNTSYIHFVGFHSKKNPMLVKGYEIYIRKHFTGARKFLIYSVLQMNSIVKEIKLVFKKN